MPRFRKGRSKILAVCAALLFAGLLFTPNAAQAVICANAGAGAGSGDDNGQGINTACGGGAEASGVASSAYGAFANASGNGAVAVGNNSTASGFRGVAIGDGSTASGSMSAAFGTGATATRDNQQVFGTATNTYTMSGITSGASKAAQGSPTHIVTSNGSGDLAAYTPAELGLASSGDINAVQRQINVLRQNDRELMDGVALSLALAQPIFRSGQNFAMRAGWGNFQGSNALAFSAAGVVNKGLLGPTSSVVLDGGIGLGTAEGVVGGRAGVTVGW